MKRLLILPELVTALLVAGLFLNALWEGVAIYIGYFGIAIRLCFDLALFLAIAFYYLMFVKKRGADYLLLAALDLCLAAGFMLHIPPLARLIYSLAPAALLIGVRIRGRTAAEAKETEAPDSAAVYYKNIEERYMRSRELWHDMRGHIAVLNSYINRGDYEGMKEYTAEFCGELEKTIIPFRTGSMAADIVLGDKLYIAKKHRIDVRLSLAPLDGLAIKSSDLCVVLSNLMDNAIEACLRLEEDERYINIRAVWNGGSCFLSIENPCRGADTSRSSKQNSERHGIGLRSVERIIHSCGGMFVTSPGERTFRAVAELR
ncbi:MAG: sensor histidine kinase [Candidatus Ornithomonoglobus sp.]